MAASSWTERKDHTHMSNVADQSPEMSDRSLPCQRVTISRQEEHHSVSAPDGSTWYVAAWLTIPDLVRRDELQILIHGASYDHRYWDWPDEPHTYSYVEFAAERGCATLAIDRIGCGVSSRPPGRQTTIAAQASIVSQLVAAAREGRFGGRHFRRVVLVGHSLGSVLTVAEAATYDDVDAVVLTAYMPIESTIQDNDPRADLYFVPAQDEPGTAHLRGLVDEDYLTPLPASRLEMFYLEETADPTLLDLDEQIKGTMTRGELSDIGTAASRGSELRVPSLVFNGDSDALTFEHPTQSSVDSVIERARAVSPQHFDYLLAPRTGHNVNLHHTAPSSYSAIADWLDGLT
jgi:pimeloyl-ACP methyl ester carboxylesterase